MCANDLEQTVHNELATHTYRCDIPGVLGLTRQIPGLALVQIDVDHRRAAVDADHRAAAAAVELLGEVVEHELVVPRMEPEPRRKPRLHRAQRIHDRHSSRTTPLSFLQFQELSRFCWD
jgi:hypothetical protein